MDVNIRRPDDREDFDSEMNHLLDTLVKAFGADLPDAIEGVTEGCDRYDLHVCGEGFGNAYGETLATHGWTIVGYHTYHTDGDDVDTVSVRPIEDCESYDTIMYSHNDESRVLFDEVTDEWRHESTSLTSH